MFLTQKKNTMRFDYKHQTLNTVYGNTGTRKYTLWEIGSNLKCRRSWS